MRNNQHLLQALSFQGACQIPVWLMRQAGRYMPSYQKLRQKHALEKLFFEPSLSAEVTLLPLQEFELDAGIIFSDILVAVRGLGLSVDFSDQGPVVLSDLKNPLDVYKLPKIDPEEACGFVEKSIKLVKPQLKVPLLGFAAAPFTLAAYILEGKAPHHLNAARKWIYSAPCEFEYLIDQITHFTIQYLKMQARAGADAVQLFESWGGKGLEDTCIQRYVLEPQRKIIEALKAQNIPVILFGKDMGQYCDVMTGFQPSAISVDWTCNLSEVRKITESKNIALQGNLDPAILFAPWKVIQNALEKQLKSMKGNRRYIFNLGHGILPQTPYDHVKKMVDFVHQFSVTEF